MTRLLVAIVSFGALVACVAGTEQDQPVAELTTANPANCDPDNGGLTLPEGFCAKVVADNLGRVRHLDVAADGTLYVRNRGAQPDQEPPAGGIVALRDGDGDGRADIQEWFGDHFGTGLEIRGDDLYVSTDLAVLRYRLTPGQLVPEGEPELIVDGFPEQRSHAGKAFAFDDAGGLYVNVGAPSNACQETDRTEGSPGLRPCPLLEQQAGIWRFDAERAGQDQVVDGSRFITGTRNIVAVGWDPTSGGLHAAQHGRDQLAALYSQYFDDETSADQPSEEFMRLEEGGNFGWPYCYHDRVQGRKVLSPEYGGDGQEIGECGQYDLPLVAFPGHWAPNDLTFYTGDQFPQAYRNGAFIAFHGSWNRAPLPQGGYQVAFVPMAEGHPTGDYQTFADGFAGVAPLMDPQDAIHRPTGLAVGPDGSLYVSDDAGGRIWRIMYTGS